MRLLPISILLLTTPAIARPPPGVDPQSPEHTWWECHVVPTTNRICCRESDGHVLGDDDWRTAKDLDGSLIYQIRVGSKWYNVPEQAVVNDLRRCGAEPDPVKRSMAKVWYYPIWGSDGVIDVNIRCFIVGTMY
jgi:hypothetical protein